jgi:hypothetical protein
MEKFNLESDIPVFCVKAVSFPAGIMEAHQKLNALVPMASGRRYFGISRPDRTGVITYKAAAEELLAGEAKQYKCESFTILKGSYSCTTIKDYLRDPQSISKAFSELLKNPELDPNGYCLEWYLDEKDVKCMVKLKS